MLKFTPEQISNFKKLQNIKENPGVIEEKLVDKTIKYVNYVKWIPGLKMIAIGNSVSMNSANKESDIDLFIVTKPNRLWINRILITFIFHILGVRKNDKFHKEKFCLSFFCTTNALSFESIAIENDIYLYNRILHLLPILNYDNTYELFIAENNKWMEFNYGLTIKNYESKEKLVFPKKNMEEKQSKIKGRFFPSQEGQNREENDKYHHPSEPLVLELDPEIISGSLMQSYETSSERQSILLNYLEEILKSIFLPKTKRAFIKLGKPFGVIINDDMLKFHNDDKRKEIRDKIIGK